MKRMVRGWVFGWFRWVKCEWRDELCFLLKVKKGKFGWIRQCGR